MTPLYLSHFALRRRRTSAPTKGAIMSFAIITDSTSDISPACAQELGIYVIPLHVVIEGEDLLDQVQITAEEYVARMAGSKQLPHTSQPSAGEFKALFDRVLADGHDSAIFISLCSEWSACYANACLVADTHELDVRCVDSRTGSGAEGLLVEYALAMRDDGRSLDETEAQIRATLPDAHLLVIPRTLENLVKNGRAPKLAGHLTQMLNIRLAVSPSASLPTPWQIASTFCPSIRARAYACSQPAPSKSKSSSTRRSRARTASMRAPVPSAAPSPPT